MSKIDTIQEINEAIGTHGKWKLRLKTAISRGSSDITPDKVRRDNLCDFGTWLYGSKITPEIKAGKPYKVVKRLHGEFHVLAASVMQKAVDGQGTAAEQLLDGEFKDKSQILVKALTKWKRELQDS